MVICSCFDVNPCNLYASELGEVRLIILGQVGLRVGVMVSG